MTDSNPAPSSAPTVVLVHGAWADGSSWRRVIARLLRAGVAVRAVQNPTTSLVADVEATRRVIAEIDGPVVLCGHSWGGTVITEAGDHPGVRALVFVAAFAPGVGESTGDQVQQHPAPPGLGTVTPDRAGGLRMQSEGWLRNVAQDLPEEEALVLAALQPHLPQTTFSEKVARAAWTTRPNWYVVSSEDRAVSVELQRTLAARLQARTTALKSSHMSPLSHPDEVTNVILDAVRHVEG